MLDQGYKTTSLYTDLENPTSNKIYMDIGYEPIMDSILLLLVSKERKRWSITIVRSVPSL
jgi:hypothetical protein